MKTLLLLCALLLPISSEAAVALVNTGTLHTNNAPASPTTDTSLTIASGTNLALVVYAVGATTGATVPFTVTWGGTNVPIVSGANTFDGNTASQIDIFCLANPATGNQTLSVSYTGTFSGNIAFFDAVFSGVNQTTPCASGQSGFSATSAPFSLTVATTSGDIAVGFYNTANIGTLNGTTFFTSTAGNATNDAGNYLAATSSSTSLTFNTGANTVGVAVDVQQAGGGGSCTHSGITSGGAIAIPNGTSGSYRSCAGTFVTPDCSTVTYRQTVGACAVN